MVYSFSSLAQGGLRAPSYFEKPPVSVGVQVVMWDHAEDNDLEGLRDQLQKRVFQFSGSFDPILSYACLGVNDGFWRVLPTSNFSTSRQKPGFLLMTVLRGSKQFKSSIFSPILRCPSTGFNGISIAT